jgi:galactokinase
VTQPDEVRWRSPGRVNLIGEHTDYNDGFCLPLAIAQGCTATVSRLDDAAAIIVSAQRDAPVALAYRSLSPQTLPGDQAWAGYAAGIVWALQQRGFTVPGVAITVDGDVPAGAGLSSSAALECAVASAINELAGLGLERAEVVAVARQAENEFVGAPTGGMDQLASVFGQAGHVLLCDMRSLTVEAVPFDLAAAELVLLVIDSRAEHQLVDGLYGERRAACEKAAQLLGVRALRDLTLDDLPAIDALPDDELRKRARHVVTENDRTLAVADLLRAGQIHQIGPLLTASHLSLRDDFEVSAPEVDLAVEVMLAFGAHGARITGGGFGGCAIGLMNPADAQGASAAVEAVFAGRNYHRPASFVVTPSMGSHPI